MVRTKKLLLETKPIYKEISMAAAAVWNQCLTLMDFYQYQRGYPHAHRDFYFDKDCEGWMDKQISDTHPLHSQSIQSIRARYFQS